MLVLHVRDEDDGVYESSRDISFSGGHGSRQIKVNNDIRKQGDSVDGCGETLPGEVQVEVGGKKRELIGMV